MSDLSPQHPAAPPRKPWYLKWWVWLVVVVVIAGGVNAAVNPNVDKSSSGASAPTQTVSPLPTAVESPARPAPLDLEAFLSASGVAFDSSIVSARKARIYVPTGTTGEQAQRIATDVMLYICDYAVRAGDKFLAANRVEVSDGVSIYTPGYNAVDHPSAFATDETCQG